MKQLHLAKHFPFSPLLLARALLPLTTGFKPEAPHPPLPQPCTKYLNVTSNISLNWSLSGSCPSPRSTARSCTQCRRPPSTASRRTLSAPTSTTGNQDLEKHPELAENLENGKDKGQQASLIRGLTGHRCLWKRERKDRTEKRRRHAAIVRPS